jgi:hypothetical protein
LSRGDFLFVVVVVGRRVAQSAGRNLSGSVDGFIDAVLDQNGKLYPDPLSVFDDPSMPEDSLDFVLRELLRVSA